MLAGQEVLRELCLFDDFTPPSDNKRRYSLKVLFINEKEKN
jgi:hypothetical protein